MNTRRKLMIALGAGALTTPLAAIAQQKPAKVWRIGFFCNGSRQAAVDTGRYGAFLEGMRMLGYVQGKHFVIEERFVPEGDYDRLPLLAAELMRSNVDVIVVTGSPLAVALRQANTTVPVVVTITANPVREGLAASLGRPGANFTGLTAFLDDVFPKHVELLKTAVPKLSRIAALSKAGNPGHAELLSGIEAAARHNAIQVLRVDAGSNLKDIERGVDTMARGGAQAFIILGDGFFVQHFPQIAQIAIRHRLASMYSGREYPEAGGFMSYGPDFSDNFRRAATYVDKILKGAKPGDLPFEQPTRLHLVINRDAARRLGLVIPQELLLRADKVIE